MALTKINSNSYTTLDATKLTGNLPAISGASLTGISGGKVLQAVHYRKDADTRMSADGVVHSGINITPSATSSKILVLISATIESTGGVNSYAFCYLRRNIGGSINTTVQIANALGYQINAGVRPTISCNSLDEPNTTSQVTYELYHDDAAGGDNYDYYETNYTLLEIGA